VREENYKEIIKKVWVVKGTRTDPWGHLGGQMGCYRQEL
jgi:hypothetical protein